MGTWWCAGAYFQEVIRGLFLEVVCCTACEGACGVDDDVCVLVDAGVHSTVVLLNPSFMIELPCEVVCFSALLRSCDRLPRATQPAVQGCCPGLSLGQPMSSMCGSL